MMVQSPLELYTVYLGFKYYNVIWQACTLFGIAFLPFLMLMVTSLTKPFENPHGNGADLSFRQTFIELFSMILVCYLCVAPVYPLDVQEIEYQPVCEASAQKSVLGDTGTTYDDAFQGLRIDTVKMPLLLGLGLHIASGFTHAVTQSFPCTDNIDETMHAVVMTRLSHEVRDSVARFNNECFVPAKTMFNKRQPDVSTYQETMNRFGGESDLTWMGSHVLRQLYYSDIYPHNPVKPFPYSGYTSSLIDHNVDEGLQNRPDNGFPNCESWWSDPTYGLQARIVSDVENRVPVNSHLTQLPFKDRVLKWMHKLHLPFTSDETADDVITRGALYNSDTMRETHLDTGGGMFSHLANVFITLDQVKDNLFQEPADIAKAQDILPIVQAIALFLLLMFYPLLMIAGNYSLRAFTGLLFLTFSLIFSSCIWHGLTIFQNAINDSISYFNAANSQQKPIFNNFFTILYYVTPILFNSLAAGVGLSLGGAMSSLVDKSNAVYGPNAGASNGANYGSSNSSSNNNAAASATEVGEEALETAALL